MGFTEPIGINFRPEQEVTIENLKLMLQAIWSFIKSKETSQVLFRYDDWWEHDGLHFQRDKLTLVAFLTSIGTTQAILESMPGDFNVKVGICTPNSNWYLRYYVDLEDDAKECFFDITIPADWEKDFEQEMEKAAAQGWVKEKSQDYYKAIKA
jgi:hypothetical protein